MSILEEKDINQIGFGERLIEEIKKYDCTEFPCYMCPLQTNRKIHIRYGLEGTKDGEGKSMCLKDIVIATKKREEK